VVLAPVASIVASRVLTLVNRLAPGTISFWLVNPQQAAIGGAGASCSAALMPISSPKLKLHLATIAGLGMKPSWASVDHSGSPGRPRLPGFLPRLLPSNRKTGRSD
jgi:hypothetical protein